ncbi:hypothetical protein DL96DRAFT_1605405 [Flagelloscypha sp. PMI_526]|nr:hypothetical protein DL96DRAFT_1605405 [Flagelloscypha sp. PMI_526]
MPLSKLVALVALPALVHAFSNTVPVAVWSLHASDLRTLPHSSSLVKSLKSAHSSRQFPYLRDDQTPLDVSAAAQSVSDRCGSLPFEKGSKHVLCMTMPHMHADHPNGRKGTAQQHDALFSSELSAIKAAFPKHLIIVAGTSVPSSFLKRQAPDSEHPSRPVVQDGANTNSDAVSAVKPPYVNGNSTVPKNAGVLKKYQLLTPGLILSLIIAFGLLLPAALVGFSALASIQSFDASTKKTQ